VDYAENPEAMVELLFVAMIALPGDRDGGHHMLTRVLDTNAWQPFDGYPGGRRLRRGPEGLFDIFRHKPEILASYCGATPAGRYLDGDLANCVIKFDRKYSARMQGVRDDRATFYVDIGGGAPRPRPVKLKRKSGGWAVSSYSGLLTGVVRAEE
jgi:hypothetical protein